jgi:phosphatidate cytidylyltransferase
VALDPHVKRWLTALVGLPILVVAIGWGGFTALFVLVLLAATVGLKETVDMLIPPEDQWSRILGLACGFVTVSGSIYGSLAGLGLTFTISIFIIFIAFTLGFRRRQDVVGVIARLVFCAFYPGFLLGHLLLIRNFAGGKEWVIFAIFVVFAADTGAFYSGRKFGKRRLYPEVSPKKTVEGSLGGILAAMVVGALLSPLVYPSVLPHSIVLAFCLAVVSQFGDLFASMLKRAQGVKDSGRVLPGHGGMLDRLDSLVFSIPVLYYYLVVVIGVK